MSELKEETFREKIKWTGFSECAKIQNEINRLNLKHINKFDMMGLDKWQIRIYVAGQVNKLKRNEYRR
jgi:hypothetical protein